MPVSVLLILGMGAAVGFISGLFGIGGGFLMTPLLIFLGIPPAVAVATQSAQIVASSSTSVLGALRRNALDHKLGANWDDGHRSIFTYEYLASLCPCDACTDERGGPPVPFDAIGNA